MAETINNFENKFFNPFSNQGNILLNNNYDPDENFFNEADISKIDAQYVSMDKLQETLSTCKQNKHVQTNPFQFYMLTFAI